MISFRILSSTEFEKLRDYLNALSPETKSRFGPHGYDLESIRNFYMDSENTGVVGVSDTDEFAAYAILRRGYLEHDRPRLEGYGLKLSAERDSTFAPAIADAWQGKGIGSLLFEYVEGIAREKEIYRIILWGGVQASNDRAIRYYEHLGFRSLGSFEYHGWNQDMIYEVPVYKIREINSSELKAYQTFFQKGLIEDEDSFRISPADNADAPFPTCGKPDSFTLAAYIGGSLAGVASFEREGKNLEKLRHKGLLFRMLVSRQHRGKGVGQGLIREIVKRARKLGDIEQINLTVIANNPTAQRLYERAGFRVFSHEKNAVKRKSKYFDELTMVRFIRN